MKKIIKYFTMIMTCMTLFSASVGCSLFEKPVETPKKYYDVMSFNIRTQTDTDTGKKNWSFRSEHVIQYVMNSDMDVVCMQEVRKVQFDDISQQLADKYTVKYYPRENGTNPEGLAICYAKDFELVEEQMFWLSETPEKMSLGWGASYYRICANVLLKDKEGDYLNIVNVHLDHEVEKARSNGLSLIMERVSMEYPTVVCGDFNTTERSGCYQLIADEMWDCQKSAPITDEGLTYHNWGEKTSGTPIDFCFINTYLKAVEFDIVQETIEPGVYYSDHYAITAKVETLL